MPGRSRQIREETRHPARQTMAELERAAKELGHRRRTGMGELERILARHLVWCEALLQLAGEQGLQDAHPRAAVALSRVHPVHGVRRQPPETGRAAVAGPPQAGRRCPTRVPPARSPASCSMVPRATAKTGPPDPPPPPAVPLLS